MVLLSLELKTSSNNSQQFKYKNDINNILRRRFKKLRENKPKI